MRKLKIRRKEKRREERRRRKGLSLFLFPPPFVFRIFLFFYYFHLFFVQRQGELSTCFNILKTLLVFHPLPVETLFRGVACAMLRVAFTGHVSPLPLPPSPPPHPPHPPPSRVFCIFRSGAFDWWKHFFVYTTVTYNATCMQPPSPHAFPLFHGRTWKRRKIDAALITLSRKKKREKTF